MNLAREPVALFDHRELLEIGLKLKHFPLTGGLPLVQVDEHIDDDEVEGRVPDEREDLDRRDRAIEQQVQARGNRERQEWGNDAERLGEQNGEQRGEQQL